MSDRAREFLAQWKSEHVLPVPDTHQLREAGRLAAMCREDANCACIPPQELRIAAGHNMIRNMLAALAATEGPSDENKGDTQSILHRLFAHIPAARGRTIENVGSTR
jgi:hypothetical protein